MERGLRQVFAVCGAFHLSREQRLDWASVVLNQNVSSFNELGPVESARLVDAANGAAYMARIWIERRNGERVHGASESQPARRKPGIVTSNSPPSPTPQGTP
jgi:hypothetical protein